MAKKSILVPAPNKKMPNMTFHHFYELSNVVVFVFILLVHNNLFIGLQNAKNHRGDPMILVKFRKIECWRKFFVFLFIADS